METKEFTFTSIIEPSQQNIMYYIHKDSFGTRHVLVPDFCRPEDPFFPILSGKFWVRRNFWLLIFYFIVLIFQYNLKYVIFINDILSSDFILLL